MDGGHVLFVGNIPPNLLSFEVEIELQALWPTMISFQLKTSPPPFLRSKGFGFASFASAATASEALSIWMPIKLRGCKLNISFAKSTPAREVDAATMSTVKTLFVSNIPITVKKEDLYHAFLRFGDLVKASLSLRPNGISRGFGFVEFKERSSAIVALNQLHGLFLGGAPVTVELAKPQLSEYERRQRVALRKASSNDEIIERGTAASECSVPPSTSKSCLHKTSAVEQVSVGCSTTMGPLDETRLYPSVPSTQLASAVPENTIRSAHILPSEADTRMLCPCMCTSNTPQPSAELHNNALLAEHNSRGFISKSSPFQHYQDDEGYSLYGNNTSYVQYHNDTSAFNEQGMLFQTESLSSPRLEQLHRKHPRLESALSRQPIGGGKPESNYPASPTSMSQPSFLLAFSDSERSTEDVGGFSLFMSSPSSLLVRQVSRIAMLR